MYPWFCEWPEAAKWWPLLCVCGLLTLHFAWRTLCAKEQTQGDDADFQRANQDASALADLMQGYGIPAEPHEEQFVFSDPPLNRFFYNNEPPAEYQTSLVHGKWLALHRATYNKNIDNSGEYPYGKYFLGKKRLWEGRMQLKFKQPVNAKDIYFGMVMNQYVPMNAATKLTVKVMLNALRRIVGNDLYFSHGDDPKYTRDQELELPHVAMPLWAFDQFIVTPEGEEPPDITASDISSLGSHRKGRVREYSRELSNLKVVPGPTYTFCFWGISQFLDCLTFRVVKFGPSFSLRSLTGPLPMMAVAYVLKDKNARKHYNSLKDYIMCVAMWSSEERPELAIVEAMRSGEFARKLTGNQTSKLENFDLVSQPPRPLRRKPARSCCGL